MKASHVAITLCSLLLTSCVTNEGEWMKPGAGVDDFTRDKYACLQQSQQPTSSLYVNRYGGYGSSGVATNGGLFAACMNARGWSLMAVSDPHAYNAEVAAASAPVQQACTEYRALFARKMSCKANDTTQEQMQDRSKITSIEKAEIEKWVTVVGEANEQLASLQRKYNPKQGEAFATNIENGLASTRANVAELVAGKIT